MTKHQLRALLERAADWPKEAQAELLRSMVQIEAKYGGVYHVDDEERRMRRLYLIIQVNQRLNMRDARGNFKVRFAGGHDVLLRP